MQTLSFKTPAKINLGLKILFKRDDGFHELETLMQMVSLYDRVVLERLDNGIELICDQPDIPDGPENLVWRAAQILRELFPERGDLGVRIRLEKKIPSGGGLGGGSGNAAGVLLGLNRMWGLGLSWGKLMDLAARLGSDAPFFLSAPCAIGRGRGERLEPVKAPKKFKVILIHPHFPVSTPWAYQNLKLKLTKSPNNISILQKFLSQSDIVGLGAKLDNDLEAVVIKQHPVIQTIKEALTTHGACGSLLSGSGSTVFGIFNCLEDAERALTLLNTGDWDVFLTETVENLNEFYPEEMLNYPVG